MESPKQRLVRRRIFDMTWNPKVELIKHAVELAKEKHPEGFNKAKLIECSEEVFGGFGANPNKPIQTHEDIAHMQNRMAKVDGGYPLGMSGCEVVGINGGCGATCPVFKVGECGEPQEFDKEFLIDELGQEEAEEVMEYYACFDA